MSTLVFPTDLLLGWSVIRTPEWATRKNEAISGAETTIRDRAYPRYTWDITFEVLRQGFVGDPTGWPWTEYAQLFGFYNAMGGGWDSFLWRDNLDSHVTGQGIGTTDGINTTYQLLKSFGGFTEPVFAPYIPSVKVYLNGALQTNYTLNPWGTQAAAGPGTIQFGFTPSVGQAITVDMDYYYPCRFVEDKCQFEQFALGYSMVKKLTFRSFLQGYSE